MRTSTILCQLLRYVYPKFCKTEFMDVNTTAQVTASNDLELICKPATNWTSIYFHLVNYIAYYFTVRSFPGRRRHHIISGLF